MKRKQGIRSLLSIDLSQVYDKVWRHKLFAILKERAKTDVDRTAVSLIEKLYVD
jgi:hypothetical protein